MELEGLEWRTGYRYVDFNGEGLQFKDAESEKKVIDWLTADVAG